MDFSAIISALLEIAQKVTAFVGEGEASGIITIVKNVLEQLDLNSIISALTALIGA